MKTNKIKIALVDDEILFVEGLKLILSHLQNITIIQTFTNGLDVVDYLNSESAENIPEIFFIDIQMQPMNGFELVEKIKISHPSIKIIILSSHYSQNFIGYMLKLGVAAFLPKNANLETLTLAIDKVNQHGFYFSDQEQIQIVNYIQNKNKTNTNRSVSIALSERETEITQLICQELTTQEIADKLFISKRTVDTHRQNILDKIGAKNIAGIVLYAIANQIHSPFSDSNQ